MFRAASREFRRAARIVQLTDIHVGTLVHPDRELQRLVDSVNALKPDLIVFTGRPGQHPFKRAGTRRHADTRARFAAPVYSVTGNHDIGSYIKDTIRLPKAESLAQVIERQTQMGWQVLQDTTVYLHRGNDSISLSGISFDLALYKAAPRLGPAFSDLGESLHGRARSNLQPHGRPSSQLWPQIRNIGRGDLTLAGHVHSMQMKIRIFRP